MNKFPLNSLPNELKIVITPYLSPQDCARLGASCKWNYFLTYEFGNATQDDLLNAVRRTDNVELVKQMLKCGVNPAAQDNYAIRWAAGRGHTDVVKLLLGDPRVDAGAVDNAHRLHFFNFLFHLAAFTVTLQYYLIKGRLCSGTDAY